MRWTALRPNAELCVWFLNAKEERIERLQERLASRRSRAFAMRQTQAAVYARATSQFRIEFLAARPLRQTSQPRTTSDDRCSAPQFSVESGKLDRSHQAIHGN